MKLAIRLVDTGDMAISILKTRYQKDGRYGKWERYKMDIVHFISKLGLKMD